MVIAIALFGFALGGTLLSIMEAANKNWLANLPFRVFIRLLTVLYSIFAIASFAVLNCIPLDYFRLPFEWLQLVFLLASYLTLALPFFLSGLVVALCYTYIPQKTAFIYFASMTGSACGAVMPAIFLPYLGEAGTVALAAALPLPTLFLKPSGPEGLTARKRPGSQTPVFSTLPGLLVALFVIISAGVYFLIEVKPSPYKSLSQTLRLPDAHLLETHTTLRGRIDRVDSPHIRFAPGLSLKYTRPLPGQSALYHDGDRPLVLYHPFVPSDRLFARHTLSFSGYQLYPHPESVLLIQNGGGLGILCALASQTADVTVVEQNVHIARALKNHYHLPVINQAPRSFLARSDRLYRVIQIENWGGSIPAADALTQEHLFTREAFAQYFKHLLPGGFLILTRKLLLPPSDIIRLWAASFEGLRAYGVRNPEKNLAVLRNWDSYTLIASTRSLHDLTPLLQSFAKKNNFDVVYLDKIEEKEINRFNIFKAPYHYLAVNRLKQAYRKGTESDFFSGYPLDVGPQSDQRPYPSRFLKWPRIREIYKASGSRIYSLLMSGELVVLTVFAEAAFIAVILLILPLLLTAGTAEKPRRPQIFYFLSVGMGFMFLELYYIKALVLLFGNPVVSLAVVLATVLIFSGIGGFYSERFESEKLGPVLIALVAVLGGYLFCCDPIIHRLLALSLPLQYLFAVALMLPASLLMGLPFPLGMRCLLAFPEQRSYAWAVNGCASILTSIISAQIALSVGLTALLLGGILSYLLAWFCVVSLKSA